MPQNQIVSPSGYRTSVAKFSDAFNENAAVLAA